MVSVIPRSSTSSGWLPMVSVILRSSTSSGWLLMVCVMLTEVVLVLGGCPWSVASTMIVRMASPVLSSIMKPGVSLSNA